MMSEGGHRTRILEKLGEALIFLCLFVLIFVLIYIYLYIFVFPS